MEPERAHQPQAAGRSPQGEVLASEVVRLWAAPSGPTKRNQRNFKFHKGVRVAAVRPYQQLSSDDYELLENSGVLVVEIPADVPSETDEEVARYLTQQLEAGVEATARRMAALGTIQNGRATELGDFFF
jgi:hypothetical protein